MALPHSSGGDVWFGFHLQKRDWEINVRSAGCHSSSQWLEEPFLDSGAAPNIITKKYRGWEFKRTQGTQGVALEKVCVQALREEMALLDASAMTEILAWSDTDSDLLL